MHFLTNVVLQSPKGKAEDDDASQSDVEDLKSVLDEAKLSTLRTVLACGVKLGMHFNQMDIKTAYLNAPIQEDIYMEQPEVYQKGKQMVCKLKQSLYGLKLSGGPTLAKAVL